LDKRRRRLGLCGMALVLGACLVCGRAVAGPAEDQPLLKKAQDLESKRQWRPAAAAYESGLTKNPTSVEWRDGMQRCLRHVLQERRHREQSFKDAIVGLKKSGQVLEVYVQVLRILQAYYIEPDRTDASRLFEQGLLEMRYALADIAFQKEYLADAKPQEVALFRARLVEWDGKDVTDNESARDQLRKAAKLAQETLRLPLAVVAFEFVCGACHSLDEYTAYLTPAQVGEMQALMKGRFASVGIEVAVVDEKLVIGQIHPDSPAARSFKVGDRIVRVGGQPVDSEAIGEIRERLRGEPGSFVEVEVQTGEGIPTRSVKLERQPYVMPSVEFEKDLQHGVGYVRVLSFTETTVQELKDAVLRLQAAGMKAMILDLRGNPGGLFKSSVQTAEMFLTEGLIVHTQSRRKEFNETHRSHNPNALTFPLVLLIDGETASSAEMLAGALKENYRARLVGQPTYGKGTIQFLVPLKIVSSGVRITVARFLSPSGEPYNGRGVTPHVIVEVSGDAAQNEVTIRAVALREALEQFMMMPR
jgi:carboxyl-terminal processing protease